MCINDNERRNWHHDGTDQWMLLGPSPMSHHLLHHLFQKQRHIWNQAIIASSVGKTTCSTPLPTSPRTIHHADGTFSHADCPKVPFHGTIFKDCGVYFKTYFCCFFHDQIAYFGFTKFDYKSDIYLLITLKAEHHFKRQSRFVKFTVQHRIAKSENFSTCTNKMFIHLEQSCIGCVDWCESQVKTKTGTIAKQTTDTPHHPVVLSFGEKLLLFSQYSQG